MPAELQHYPTEGMIREGRPVPPQGPAIEVNQDASIRAFQRRVAEWLRACFGGEIANDKMERNHRFFEEAAEVVQSAGMTASEAHQLIDYVFGCEVGELKQEVGGAMITLAALCYANGVDAQECAKVEVERIYAKMPEIRAKQAAKPKHGPLPEEPKAQLAAQEGKPNGPNTVDGNTLLDIWNGPEHGFDGMAAAFRDYVLAKLPENIAIAVKRLHEAHAKIAELEAEKAKGWWEAAAQKSPWVLTSERIPSAIDADWLNRIIVSNDARQWTAASFGNVRKWKYWLDIRPSSEPVKDAKEEAWEKIKNTWDGSPPDCTRESFEKIRTAAQESR